MVPIREIEGQAVPLRVSNVDTDMIIPARYLKTITRKGLGRGAFEAFRSQPGNILDDPAYAHANILIAGDNFGCGSSREHAPWALLDFGIHCVIAPSIADIFYNNCFKNGILPIVLPAASVERLIALVTTPAMARLKISLIDQTILSADDVVETFVIDSARKRDLIDGIDEIVRTLGEAGSIDAFERRDAVTRPWICDLQNILFGEQASPAAGTVSAARMSYIRSESFNTAGNPRSADADENHNRGEG